MNEPTGLEGISALASVAAQFGILPNRADIDLRSRIVSRLHELTAQDDATLIAYLNRRAEASTLPASTAWLYAEHDIMVDWLNGEQTDWSA